jgi:hypothetical protein
VSKTQQKKARKRERKTLLELADLYRKRAAADEALARLYETQAEGLKDARPADTQEA